MRRQLHIIGWVGLLGLRIHAASPDYTREIKPLLGRQCVACHGATQQKGGLRLDTAAAAIRGGEHGPAVRPGEAASSPLLQTIEGIHAEVARMPYKRPPLDSDDITRLRSWIDSGARHPADEPPTSDRHWSFTAPSRPPIPARTAEGAAMGNPIDAFVVARLQEEGLGASAEAGPETLLRRVFLDLTGLPPTPAEVAEFAADHSPGAYAQVVDRLLRSPHYGERWGRWWLDAARYADSNGYSIDSPRSIWPYRDWVVKALNEDLPFDRFTILQLAGDLRPRKGSAPPVEDLVATGFHRNTQVNHEGGIDPEQFRIESVVDRVNTTATVWLGLTLACAQCHDHKFDPLTMRDYYGFFAFFNSCENDGHGGPSLEAANATEIGSDEQLQALAAHRNRTREAEQALKTWIEQDLRPRQAAWEAGLTADARSQLKAEVRASLEPPPGQRNEFQATTAFNAFRDQDSAYRERRRALDELRRKEPRVPTSLVMRELPSPRETRVLIKGDFTRPGEIVRPATPVALTRGPATDSQLNRLDLAEWLVSPRNPLTARVLVNRIWQQYFGRGIVETENDFGTQGAPPTHPELLDWLALELVENGWSLKHLHRLIVTSSTYRQASIVAQDEAPGGSYTARERDPLNRLLWHQNRLRLDAEVIRDSMLAASGLLDDRLGGPPVFPPQPPGLDAFTQNKREWKTSTGGDRHRRGIYTHRQRTTFHPALGVFDAADGSFACTRRMRSNTPLQALTLLNGQAFVEFAEALGRRLAATPGDDAARIETGFILCLGRKASAPEKATMLRLVRAERSKARDEQKIWFAASRVLLNLDETVTRE